MNLELSIALDTNPRSRPILDGTVSPDAIDLVPTPLHPSEMFWRQLKFGDFDVSEMSFSSLIKAIARGDDRWVGIPVFTAHHFFQNWILVRKAAGIDKPEDMRGKRVGVPEFQQTAAVWSRGVLKHEFGVDQTEMEYFMGIQIYWVSLGYIFLYFAAILSFWSTRQTITPEGTGTFF